MSVWVVTFERGGIWAVFDHKERALKHIAAVFSENDPTIAVLEMPMITTDPDD